LQALRWTRFHAEELNVKPDQVGVMGFSAGGHLALTAASLFDTGDPSSSTPLGKTSSRPDFAILVYPVIAMGEEFTHKGSQENLLGANPPADLIRKLSTQ